MFVIIPGPYPPQNTARVGDWTEAPCEALVSKFPKSVTVPADAIVT